jgi:hypothetical protein
MEMLTICPAMNVVAGACSRQVAQQPLKFMSAAHSNGSKLPATDCLQTISEQQKTPNQSGLFMAV